MTAIYVVTEDALSEAVIDRIIQFVGGDIEVVTRMRRNGIGYLKSKFPELVKLARSVPVLMLVDLDRKECAPSVLREWSQGSELPDGLLFRVAVHEVEAWLLADHEAFAEFARAPIGQLPANPDELDDPKKFLLNLIRRYARRPTKDSLLPRRGANSTVGIGYNNELIRFVKESWRPDRAAESSDSLARMIPRVRAL